MKYELLPCKGCKRGFQPLIARKGDLALVICEGYDNKSKGCGGRPPRIPDDELETLANFTAEWWNKINADE